MLQSAAEFLSLSGEPALLIRGDSIVFANAAANALLGGDCVGNSFRRLFGNEIAGMQAPAYVGELELGGRRLLLRVRTTDGLRAVVLSPCGEFDRLLGDALLCALRTELMNLQTCISLIRSRTDPEDAELSREFRSVRQSFGCVNRVLSNLAVIRGAEAGDLSFRPQNFELCGLLRDLVETVRLHFPTPELCFSGPESLQICADPGLIELMVLNLLSNSLRHAAPCTQISLRVHTAGEMVILSVNDDGCGIPGEMLNTVMDRYRYGTTPLEAHRGAGLGLTAVRAIARRLGGTLLLESREGFGTAVRVSLSRAPRQHAALGSYEEAYRPTYDTILLGLADCLPPEAFDAPFTE